MQNKIFVSRHDAADMLSISLPTLDRLVRDGKIRHSKLGSRVLFTITDLNCFAEERIIATMVSR